MRAAQLVAAALVCVLAAACGDGSGTFDYDLELDVTGPPARIGALQLEVTHLGDSGGFIGRGDKVDCVALVDAIAASNNPGERVLKVGLISLSGIATPAPILRCGFRTSESLTPASFQVDVTDASLTNGEQIDPPPTVVVGSIVRRDNESN